MFDVMNSEKPRSGPFAEQPGAYEQAIRLLTPIIDPGETIRLEQYFTGYGSISAPKLQFYPSDEIFDLDHSKVKNGLKLDGNKLAFGGHVSKLGAKGFTIGFGGLKAPKWSEQTFFFDVSDGVDSTPQIATEQSIQSAPFEYELRTRKNVRPGKYYLEFHLSYYDGKSWRINSKKAEFQVRNILERHQVSIGVLALILSVAGLCRLVIWPLYQFGVELWCAVH